MSASSDPNPSLTTECAGSLRWFWYADQFFRRTFADVPIQRVVACAFTLVGAVVREPGRLVPVAA
jgi:hypothetical protein